MANLRLDHLFFAVVVLIAFAVVLTENATGLVLENVIPVASPGSGGEVVREVLVETRPATAPGEDFELVRYVVPPDVTLPAHTHPGVQMNVIESGTLTYYLVAAGEVTINRADGATEILGPGESTDIEAGDAFIEPAGVVHYGANDTWRPVEILTAALLTTGAPPSTLATPSADE